MIGSRRFEAGGDKSVVVATPYLESSILAIGRALAGQERLAAFVTNFSSPQRLDHLPIPGLGRLVRRKRIGGIPPDLVIRRRVSDELAHLAVRRVASRHPKAAPLASHVMYRTKDSFDRSVARLLLDSSAACPVPVSVVGISGSGARTFETAHRLGHRTVLDFVNSHPDVQNSVLRSYAGLPNGHHELMSDRARFAIEQELQRADRVLVPSHFVVKQLTEAGVEPNRIIRVPYGVDTALFHAGLRFPDKADRPLVLYVGQISYRKGVHVLVAAARKRPDIDFVIAGPMVSQGTLRGSPDNVTLLGSVPRDELPTLMRSAWMLAVPSLEDSYCLAAVEGMASGLPIIITPNTGVVEMVEDGVSGLVVDVGDAAMLAAAIGRLAEDRERSDRMGRAAASAAASLQTWNSYGEAILKVLLA